MSEIIGQLKNLWGQMDAKKRMIVVGSLSLVLVIIIFFIIWGNSPRYQLLYSSLTEADRSEIISKLEEMKVRYRMTNGGGIEVPNAVSVRANLLKEGIPRGGVVGWEIFDQNSFSATDFSNQINRQRAISGELTRTLQRMDGITDAKIFLNLPDSSEYLFAEDKPVGTASVQLQLRAPGTLSRSQVEAITNLVAASTGIAQENVTIIDNYANDLTAELHLRKGSKAGIGSASDMFEAKQTYELQAEKRIESMLARVFGFNKAVIRVNADLNLDYQETKSETYGDTGVPRSEQEKSESSQGGSGAALGVPGTDTNITQYKASDGSNNQYSSEKSERTTNYEISKVEDFRISAPGKVNRLSVGVWVDGNLSAATKEKVTSTVAAALGIDQGRGDQVTVETLKFSQPAENREPIASNIPWLTIIISILAALIIGGAIFFMKKKSVKEPPARDVLSGARIDTIIEDNSKAEQAAAIELSPEEKVRIENLSQLEKLAMEKPDEVAALLKSWLSEEYQ